jgi:hypothetical protein
VLEYDLVSPASFAALPRLVLLTTRRAQARALAGEILERAASHHGWLLSQLTACLASIPARLSAARSTTGRRLWATSKMTPYSYPLV